MLQSIHERCIDKARKHGALFAPEKCILVHFTKARTKHNTACPLTLLFFTTAPSPSACVLRIILNKMLSWQPHLQHFMFRLATQTTVLTRLMAETWGASLRVSRFLYTAVVQLGITTGCPAWLAPLDTLFFRK